jgi:hypothetical protein
MISQRWKKSISSKVILESVIKRGFQKQNGYTDYNPNNLSFKDSS